MIYASLRTIRQWHQPLTAPIYIVLGLASGAVLLNLLLRLLGMGEGGPMARRRVASPSPPRLKWALLAAHRRRGAGIHSRSRHRGWATSARCGRWSRRTRSPTSCMREMGYRVARKHALKLRNLALLLGFGLPIASCC